MRWAPLNCTARCALTVQIADFGRSTRLGAPPQGSAASGDRPVRYMSPEALATGVQDEHTDVWSFGVLLWEAASMGQIPYAHLASDEEVARGVAAGALRLQRPKGMPVGLHSLMDCCLNLQPEDRPCFAQVKIALLRVATEMGVVAMCTGQR